MVKNFIVVLLSAIFSVFLIEIILPFFFEEYKTSPKIKYYTIENGARIGKKNTSAIQYNTAGEFSVEISFNKQGFRDNKDLKNSTSKDIFVVGDSFAMGHGVDEEKRFSNVLEKALLKNVYNISIPSYVPGYVANTKYAISHGGIVKNVIVAICMENDIYIHGGSREFDKEPKKHQKDYLFKIKSFLVNKSIIYRYSTSVIHQNKFLRDFFLSIGVIKQPLYVDTYSNITNDFMDKAVESSVKELEYFKNFNTAIVIIPSRFLWIDETKNKSEYLHNQFVKELRENKYYVIDLKNTFINYKDPINELHFPIDGHLNNLGHKVSGEFIFNELKKKNIFN